MQGVKGLGGGFFNLNGTAQVVNSTFAANNADAGGSLYNFSFWRPERRRHPGCERDACQLDLRRFQERRGRL